MANPDDHGSNSHSPALRRAAGPGAWEEVAVVAYKEDATTPFKAVTRQVLFADAALGCELRYFEVAPSGHSTLERHAHVHAVMIHRGHGRCLVGSDVRDVAAGDLVFIPPMTWHQFRAAADDCLGFLCMVNAQRDTPQLPTEAELAELRADPAIAALLG